MIEPFLFFGSVYNCNVKHLPRWCCCGCEWEWAWGIVNLTAAATWLWTVAANAFEFVEEPSLQMLTRRVVVWQASHRQGKIIRNMRSSNSTCFRGIAAFIECNCNWLFQTGSGLVIHSKPPIDHWRLCCSRHISVHCGGSLTGAPGHLASLAVLAGCGSDVQSRHQVLWLLWGTTWNTKQCGSWMEFEGSILDF